MEGNIVFYVLAALGVSFLIYTLFGRRGDPTVVFDVNDPRLAKAVADAQETVGLFLQHGLPDLQVPNSDKAVKVRFTLSFGDNNTEAIWVGDIARAGPDQFTGLYENDPVHLDRLAYGERASFDLSQIIDWSWVGPDDRVYGHYSTRIMAAENAMPRGAEGFVAALADNPVPESWH